MQSIYTEQDWTNDQSFKAKPYQQIAESIYDYFLNVLPPLYPNNSTIEDYFELDIGEQVSITESFQNSEPVSHIKNFDGEYVPTYHTFATVKTDQISSHHYLGTFPEIK